jgi:hypothetical protein
MVLEESIAQFLAFVLDFAFEVAGPRRESLLCRLEARSQSLLGSLEPLTLLFDRALDIPVDVLAQSSDLHGQTIGKTE